MLPLIRPKGNGQVRLKFNRPMVLPQHCGSHWPGPGRAENEDQLQPAVLISSLEPTGARNPGFSVVIFSASYTICVEPLIFAVDVIVLLVW
jgi:hypothetical protein